MSLPYKSIGIDFGYNYSRIGTFYYATLRQFNCVGEKNIKSDLYKQNDNYIIRGPNGEEQIDEKDLKRIKQIRKLINEKIEENENYIIEDNDNISKRIIKFKNDKNGISVQEIITSFLRHLIHNMHVNIDQVNTIVITIPSNFNSQQKSIIQNALSCLKKENLKILLLEEPIAVLYSDKKEKDFNKNENYLVFSFYKDLMDFSIISIDNELNPIIKHYYYDENYNNINLINRLQSYNKLNDIDNEELFLTCNKELEKVKLDKSKINKIIIVNSTNNDELFKKSFEDYFKGINVIVLKNDSAFVDGAARCAKYNENNEDNSNIKVISSNVKLKLNNEKLINKMKKKFKK